jgi:pimeloyl-ACP methyl ester carboxylesterase
MHNPILIRRDWLLVSLIAILWIVPSIISAQSCGDFIFTDNSVDVRQSIDDCANPFELSGDGAVSSIESLLVAEVDAAAVPTVSIESFPAEVPWSVDLAPQQFEYFASLVRHEGDDYRFINEDLGSTLQLTATGTYSIIITTIVPDELYETATLWQRVRSQFIPIAHAQIVVFPFRYERHSITFTVEQAEPEPQGASSILFLPGIQASRLYTDGIIGTEDQIWEPSGNGDVRQLAMTNEGGSIETVYTRDVIDEIGIPFFGSNVYKNFLGDLKSLQSDGIIKDYEPFAYDWRYSIFDVATQPVKYPNGNTKSLLEEVLQLADESYTGKVTLIGHSNGGLVAKALLEEYGEDELEGKVDKLIMIGTPQLGTPKGVSAMLHGDILEGFGDLILSDDLLRETIKNMPGAYTLLPSKKYFTVTGSVPLISADFSDVASSIDAYGLINTQPQLDRLLLDTMDVIPDNPSINQPLTLNENLLQAARSEQAILDDWQPPEGVAVYEVVGTGLATIVGFEYQEYGCTNNPSCILNSYVKPFALFANNGDETVVRASAEAYDGNKTTAVVDLRLEGNQGLAKERNHASLTESPAVQTFVESVIKFPYLVDSIQAPEFSKVGTRFTIVSTHSPVSPRIITSDGSIIGRIGNEVFEEVIGSQYLEIAGSTYLVIPQAEMDYTIEIAGTDDGVYTLRIDELSADNQQSQIAKIVASTTASMIATMAVVADEPQNLLSDTDGDGEVDQEWTPTGELIVEQTNSTYDDLRMVISTINHRSTKRYLDWLASKAEHYYNKRDQHVVYARLEKRILKALGRTVTFAEKRGRITDEQGSELQRIINSLQNK